MHTAASVQRLASGRKLGEGLLCRFACFCLILCVEGQSVNGSVALIVMLGCACLLHVTDHNSGCCKSAEAAAFRHLKTCFPLVIQRL